MGHAITDVTSVALLHYITCFITELTMIEFTMPAKLLTVVNDSKEGIQSCYVNNTALAQLIVGTCAINAQL